MATSMEGRKPATPPVKPNGAMTPNAAA
ncbi:hypothetical protein CCACVL1_25297 [Corchorus capsularis]|uniref:Uncharacterized protein n=1 Tax=Corchorus capsularis TaxID=210143 RepID=A0A1R3GLH5_COCAP|nr:hypothetical protein CCACVL1_25297 [Corchorus capsularis]